MAAAQDETSPSPEPASRARLLFAAGAAIVLAAVVVVVLVAGSDSVDLPEPAEASAECVDSWNHDAAALSFGAHNATAHGYVDIHVTHLSDDGSELADPDSGSCAVIFARSTLDPEPGAAGQLLSEDGAWEPLAGRSGYDVSSLTELQSDALQLANAELQPDGTIVAR